MEVYDWLLFVAGNETIKKKEVNLMSSKADHKRNIQVYKSIQGSRLH